MDQDHVDFLSAKADHAAYQRRLCEMCREELYKEPPDEPRSLFGIALALLLGLLLAPVATFLAVSAALDLL